MKKFGSHFVVSHDFGIGEFFKYSGTPFIQMFHPCCFGYRAILIIFLYVSVYLNFRSMSALEINLHCLYLAEA